MSKMRGESEEIWRRSARNLELFEGRPKFVNSEHVIGHCPNRVALYGRYSTSHEPMAAVADFAERLEVAIPLLCGSSPFREYDLHFLDEPMHLARVVGNTVVLRSFVLCVHKGER